MARNAPHMMQNAERRTQNAERRTHDVWRMTHAHNAWHHAISPKTLRTSWG